MSRGATTVIHGGTVYLGEGRGSLNADIRIVGSRVESISPERGRLLGDDYLDASDAVVVPGFVDAHVHGETIVLDAKASEPVLRQGVTTLILGQDGCSVAPGTQQTLEYMSRYFAGVNGPFEPRAHSTVETYLDSLSHSAFLNVAYLIPHGNLRLDVMGLSSGAPTSSELRGMQRLVEQGLSEGAVGVSSGLDYIPSMHGSVEEFVRLAGPLREAGVPLVSHVRGYGNRVAAGVGELVEIGRRAECRVHISHLWGPESLVREVLAQGADASVDVSFDAYPYLKGSSVLTMVAVPATVQGDGPEETLVRLREPTVRFQLGQFLEGKALDRITLSGVRSGAYADLIGLTLPEASEARGQNVAELVSDMLIASDLDVTVLMGRTNFTEEDLKFILEHDLHMGSSDGIYVGQLPHPRGWAAFASMVSLYQLPEGGVDWQRVVDHLATRAAVRFGLHDRGRLGVGCVADIAVFRSDGLGAIATYEAPRQVAQGARHVLVGGTVVIRDGTYCPVAAGCAVRRIDM